MKKYKIRIAILIAIICFCSIGIVSLLFSISKNTESPKTTEAPQLREELTTFDYYLSPEELDNYPVHDMQDYITYDYAAIVNKTQNPIFKSSYLSELLHNPEKHDSCEISQEKIDDFVELYNANKELNEGIDLNGLMDEILFEEKAIKHNLVGFDNSRFYEFELIQTTHTMYSNEVHLAFHKNAFDNYKDYYKVSYDLFLEVIKEFDAETIKSCLLPTIVNTTMDTVYEKVEEKDYDYIFNAVMNGCFEFRYLDNDTDISFGVQYTTMDDNKQEPYFYINVIHYFRDVPDFVE
jgi:hypothetical protein